LEHKLTKKEN